MAFIPPGVTSSVGTRRLDDSRWLAAARLLTSAEIGSGPTVLFHPRGPGMQCRGTTWPIRMAYTFTGTRTEYVYAQDGFVNSIRVWLLR